MYHYEYHNYFSLKTASSKNLQTPTVVNYAERDRKTSERVGLERDMGKGVRMKGNVLGGRYNITVNDYR